MFGEVFQQNTEFDGDDVHKATSIHLQMDVASMLKALPSDATVYVKNESELDAAAGITDSLRSISANIKFTEGMVTQSAPGVNGENGDPLAQLAREAVEARYAEEEGDSTEGRAIYQDQAVDVVDIDKAGGRVCIHIDLNSGDMGSTVMFTIAHELTHWMKDTNLTRYRELCGIVTEGFLERGQSVDRLVKNKMEEYRQAGEELTWEEAYDEVIASSLEGVLSDGRVIDLLDAAETKSMELWEQLKSFFEDIAALIRDTVQAYRNVEPESPEGRMVMRMKDLQTQIQDVFAAGIHEGGEDFREGGKTNTAPEGGVKAQLRTVNGTEVVWISNNIFTNTQLMDPNTIANYIASHIGDVYQIIESGQSVYIGPDLPGEYTHSKYTSHLQQHNKSILKAKNKATPSVGEMIEIATNRRWEKTKHTQNKDAQYGMYRYDTYFAFPVKDRSGNITSVKAFSAELLIRNASDGKKYLYDIVNIKEDTAKALDLKNREARKGSNSAAARSSVSSSSIHNSDPKVNKNSLRYQKNEAAQTHMAEQNDAMAEDVKSLNDLVAAQKQGKAEQIRKSTTETAAAYLMKIAGAKGEKSDLADLLSDFYTYVATSTVNQSSCKMRQSFDWRIDFAYSPFARETIMSAHFSMPSVLLQRLIS